MSQLEKTTSLNWGDKKGTENSFIVFVNFKTKRGIFIIKNMHLILSKKRISYRIGMTLFPLAL